jgi:hypothetical protein
VTGSIAAVDDGAGAGNCDDAGTRAESGFEGDNGVAEHFDVGERNFGN